MKYSVILLMGVSGSGKSTIGEKLAARINFAFVDADDFHTAENKESMHMGHPLTDQERGPWLQLLAGKIHNWVRSDAKTVLACSALKASYRELLIKDPGKAVVVFLDGSYELLSARLEKRNHPFMNKDLLRSQFETLEKPKDAIDVDVSGTVEQSVELAYQLLQERERREA